MSDERLSVVLCWHMHQPQYRDLIGGGYQLPWTYLHVIKDYVDMAAHLEAVPQARAVVNFAPLLLEQISDYARQIEGYLTNSLAIRDPLLAALASPVLPADSGARGELLHACLRANEQRLIERFRPYRRLADMARWVSDDPAMLGYLSEQFLADLLMWYHLAWLGETVRRRDERVRRLIDKGEGYTVHERRELVAVIGELCGGVLGRYRRLAERGQVELSVTPYAHPIVPLLVDLASAREAMPDVPLPNVPGYPQGEARARWHLEQGIASFERTFGFRPSGCWPSEGSVSERGLQLLSEAGFRWTASGEGVLRHSLQRGGQGDLSARAAWLYQPYTTRAADVACFFRDDGLSDLIGFTYASWHADDAVANLVHNLESIADTVAGQPGRVVSIILDGENAWEYYPDNAYFFLSTLYERLVSHPRLRLTTFSECLAQTQARPLGTLVAGSWVYGTFSTWIGSAAKNRGWEMLVDAKHVFDEVAPRLAPERRAAALEQLAVCEGSDWFWWFGDENPAATVTDFDRLYRLHLANLYQLLGREPPEYLAHAFTHGGGAPAHGGTMKPGQQAS